MMHRLLWVNPGDKLVVGPGKKRLRIYAVIRIETHMRLDPELQANVPMLKHYTCAFVLANGAVNRSGFYFQYYPNLAYPLVWVIRDGKRYELKDLARSK